MSIREKHSSLLHLSIRLDAKKFTAFNGVGIQRKESAKAPNCPIGKGKQKGPQNKRRLRVEVSVLRN
jgi:hypothetical protein